MANANAMLQSNIKKIKELNAQLIKERDTIDKKILLIKFNPDGIITEISQAYEKSLGFLREDLLGVDFFHHERLNISQEIKQLIQLHMKNLTSLEYEQKIIDAFGEERWMNNKLAPEFDSYNNLVGFILFREDTTHAKKLQFHQDKLLTNSRSAAMGEMISMIAHQWRQPLSLINTVMGTLKLKKELRLLNEESLESGFQKIEETVNYLSNTIDDFRDFFKTNKLISEVSIETILEKSTSILKEEMKFHQIEYQEHYDNNITIKTLKNELVQSIINIIKNSIDAFKEQPKAGMLLSIKVESLKTHVAICIEDNAGGIDKEIINRIFEPYFSTKNANGTGLGLYMSKMIIEEHLKGQLTILSKDGTTKVIVEIPHAIRES